MTKEKNKLRIIPLGGVGEIGKNMTAIEYGENIIVIDCGLCFPREDMLGVDYVIPNTQFLEENRNKLKAFLITHGHEDHIGATPYVLPKFNTTVYGTRLTLALIEAKYEEFGIKPNNFRVIEPGKEVTCGEFRIEFVKVSHSIDDAVGLVIHTPIGNLVHTGDFKVDFTPVAGNCIDLQKFAQIGAEGVLALMSDSTNAEVPGYTESEKNVGASFETIFKETKGRIIIATFASNIHRLQQVVNEAKKSGRKICLMGRSMFRFAKVASDLGYLKINDEMLLSSDEIDTIDDSKICILTTGSQGENMSGLVRMASGEHRNVTIKQGDTVVISSTPIPGNERYVSDVINMLCIRGAKVVYSGNAQVHVSGHACQEELKLMLLLTKPKCFIPVHGEYRHLYKHAALAEELGVNKENIFIPAIGKPIEFTSNKIRFGEQVVSGSILIDGFGVGDVGNVVLRDRQVLSSEGLFIVVVTVAKSSGELICPPDIISRGFVYMKESEELVNGAKDIIQQIFAKNHIKKSQESISLKSKIKKSLSLYLYEKTKRSPMILPIFIEV